MLMGLRFYFFEEKILEHYMMMEELMTMELISPKFLDCPYTHHLRTLLISDEDSISQELDSIAE
jgi:hypothetical protein